MSLGRARDALERSAWEEALGALLDAWRDHAVPEVAILIDGLGRAIDATLPALNSWRINAHAEWLFLEAARRPRDTGRLITSLGTLPDLFHERSYEQLVAKLARLAERGTDPRFAMVGAAYVLSGHVVRFPPLGAVVLRLCVVAGDAKLVGRLERELGARGEAAVFAATVDTIRRSIPAPVPLDPDELRHVDTIARMITLPVPPAPPPRRDELAEALLATVTSQPDDDAARAVYGDHLLATGDPRGELIALQLAPALDVAGHERVRTLLDAQGEQWVAPLGSILAERRFERGFLAVARVPSALDLHLHSFEPWLEQAIWSTVRVLDTPDRALVTQFVLRGLERAALDADALHVLAERAEPVPLAAAHGPTIIDHSGRRVWSGIRVGKRTDWAAALRVGALTSLRTISLGAHAPRESRWLLESKLFQQLRWLDVFAQDAVGASAGAWLDAVAHLRALERVTFRYTHGWMLQFDRVRATRAKKPRWNATLHVTAARNDSVFLAQIRSAFAVSGFPRKDVLVLRLTPAADELRLAVRAFFDPIERGGDGVFDELVF